MSGRLALVTGASSGIGRATALLLASEGADLVLAALPDPGLEQIARECGQLGVECIAVPCDVSDPASVDALFQRAAESGNLDAVFNNAGISIVAPLPETTDAQWIRLVATNLTGSFNVARAAARAMLSRGGSIVNTGSELAIMGQAGYVAYSATKGGIVSMTRAMASELVQRNIRVNAICPGAVDTPLLRAEFAGYDDPASEAHENERSIAMGRFGRPDEIARAVLFLLSDESSYVTGATLVVDGGRTSCLPTGSLARHAVAE
jgi:NAD(P)-dependent dehydrogenase (short-subunit alcohol dehydrogenase family)